MRYEHDIIIILDSVLDDYYLLWGCFEEYKENENQRTIYELDFQRH